MLPTNATQRRDDGRLDGRRQAKADKKRGSAGMAGLSFIQTEVSRAEKIKRGKKVSRIHLNLDGIIMVGGQGREAGELPGYGAAGRGCGIEARGEYIFIRD